MAISSSYKTKCSVEFTAGSSLIFSAVYWCDFYFLEQVVFPTVNASSWQSDMLIYRYDQNHNSNNTEDIW